MTRPGDRAARCSPASAINTDPTLGTAKNLTGTRTIFYDAPNGDATLAALRSSQVDSPLTVAAGTQEEPDPPVLKLGIEGQKRKLKPGGSHRSG